MIEKIFIAETVGNGARIDQPNELPLFLIDRVGDPSLLDNIETTTPETALDRTTAQQLKPQVDHFHVAESRCITQKRRMLEKREIKRELKRKRKEESNKVSVVSNKISEVKGKCIISLIRRNRSNKKPSASI
jgi:hypothetical protein